MAQRKEYVMSTKLCLNCLKPHHVAHDCRSSYRCKAQDCGRKHNTLLHEDRPAVQTQSNHQSNSAVHSDESEEEQLEECLLMTSQVNLTGPTGRTITVRALLDSGSTLSILSTKLMKLLHLEKTGGQVSIAGVSDQSTQKQHPLARVRLSSKFRKDWSKTITVAGMEKVTRQLPLQAAESVRSLNHIKDLPLADSCFDQPGQIDLLLGQNILKHLFLSGKRVGEEDQPEAWLTVFGWTIQGSYTPNNRPKVLAAITHIVSTTENSPTTNQLLSRFYELEEPAVYKTEQTPSEMQVEEHFQQTHFYVEEQSRYMVRLPRSEEKADLGESKTQALNRARANERSLIKRQKLTEFNAVMQEYIDLGHAQPVGAKAHLPSSEIYYMPVHAVFKDSSTSTKVRAVFDASAKTTNKRSLNDLLAVGPTLHPTLSQIILNFRTYVVAISSDISKMYREVILHPADRALHRFIWRNSQDSDWKEYEMHRVTFGVAASPYLAVKTMQQAALDFGEEHPEAQWHINNSFYVDDLMGGADTPQAAIDLADQLCNILSKANFHLRKWRSNSTEVLREIPVEMQEKLPTQDLVEMNSAQYPKALGLTWDSRNDNMATHVNVPATYATTKSGIVGDIARTFDILGWLAPAILPMKIMYRDLAKSKIGWEEEVAEEFKKRHKEWRDQLHLLAEVKLPRHYFDHNQPLSVELHGFSDASKEAYAAVIYIRATYSNRTPSAQLVISKSKISPPLTRTIPELELCGANLLAKLLTTTRQTLKILLQNVFAYTDSTVVLAWLDGQPRKDKIFISNRIASTINLLPPKVWKFVPGSQNPADAASRGLSALELKNHHLWWHGPQWLITQPVAFPVHPQEAIRLLQQEKEEPVEEVVLAATPQYDFERKFNSYGKLLRTTCWMLRFVERQNRTAGRYLTSREGMLATKLLVKRSQERSFPVELSQLTADPPKEISRKSTILVTRPVVDKEGILHMGGRLNHTDLPDFQKHPTILTAKDMFTQLLFLHYHNQLGHCGPSALLAHAANIYYVVGGRKLSRRICSKCVVCRKAAARGAMQLLGQLPPPRVEPSYVFLHTGMDFCGPFNIRKGHTRHPVIIEASLAIFVCFCTKAVHLELVSDMTTQTFIAAIDRFAYRRGMPLHLYSDNGPNYVGARNQLSRFYQLIKSEECKNAVETYCFDYQVTWHNIPSRSPHFGGLWEAAVKATKYHLKRVVGQEKLTFEELSTICCGVESCLNSRPLGPITSHDIDGLSPLTPSHFLIGRAARAYPQERLTAKPTPLERWKLCQQASQHFWERWSREYLQQLQKATKWHKKSRNFKVGDMVMLTDGGVYKCQWSMAKVVAVYPGKDKSVRAVDVQIERKVIPTGCISKKQLAERITTKTSIFRRPVCKLAMLLAVDEVPGVGVNLDLPDD